MKRIQWGIIPLLICLLFTACKDDEMVSRVVEGLPVSLNMKMFVPGPSDVQTNTRATDEVETNVEKLALFFYKYENSAPNILEIPTDGLKKTEQADDSNTNYFYEITVTAEQMTKAGIMSGEYWVYAIANWNKGFCAVDSVTVKGLTKTELEEYCVLKTNNLIDLNETALLLTGKYVGSNGEEKVTLETGKNVLKDFHLKRITAKIIFNFKNGADDVEFVPTEYEIYNYSRSSTLIEREGWTNKEGAVDDKQGTHRGELIYKGSPNEGAFNSTNGRVIPLSPKPADRDFNFYFYMLENVQPAKNPITDYAERERREGAQDRTFKNAPDKGTYVIVRGSYKGKRGGNGADANEPVQGFVAYTIHLGDCSSATGSMDNFTVRRNVKYKYNITVNGVNNIIVEATTSTENQPGAEGDILKSNENVYYLDAHFETAMIKLSSQKISSYSLLAQTPYGTYTQQVPKPEEVGKPEPNIEAQYLGWVKFAAPKVEQQTNKVVFDAYPGDANVINIYELMDEINDYKDGEAAPAGGWHFVEHGNSIYVTAYVDEYYYDNEPDLRKFINAPDRRLALSDVTRVSADGESTYTERPIFAINQKSIQSIFNLNGKVVRPFGAETYEETEDAVLSTEEWGGGEPNYEYNHDPRPNWGWRNLWEQLDGYTMNNPNLRWDKYVNVSENGHFESNATQSDALKIKAMVDYYNVGLYQCFARNRDEDGDGMIDVGEMKWYLPAIDECLAFWHGAAMLSNDVKFNNTALYFTSTNSTFRTWWALEGSATGAYKMGDNPTNPGKQRVRCIRTIGKFGEDWGANDNEFSASIVEYDAQKRTIHLYNMGENTVRTAGSQRGEYTPHSYLDSQNKLPEEFQFAEKDLSYENGPFPWSPAKSTFTYNEVRNGDMCQRYYSEDADGSDLGQWRIPNQREFTLIHRYFRDENVGIQGKSNLSTYTAARSTYRREDKGADALYFTQPDGFITTTWDPAQTTLSFKIRCVRDWVTP